MDLERYKLLNVLKIVCDIISADNASGTTTWTNQTTTTLRPYKNSLAEVWYSGFL